MVGDRAAAEVVEESPVATERPGRAARLDEALRLYAEHGKPLEDEHRGKFLAIFPDGRTVVGDDLETVSREAAATMGRGSFVFRIGEVAVGTIG
jgi:hypothetical protein